MSFKRQMLESEIEKLLSVSFSQVRDERVYGKMITITSVKLSRDKSFCDITVSSLTGKIDSLIDGLNAAKGFLRTVLAKNIKMYKVPELRFYSDKGIENSEKINRILNQLDISGEEE
ncbi:MAG TPA: 30S ribosome-binding factor RbfA [Tepiditoga sp.]|nr:30S ribosome-binding factor RbfA [Tepiditoga sp.]